MMSTARIVRSLSVWTSETRTRGSGPASSRTVPPPRSTLASCELREERVTVLFPRLLVIPSSWTHCGDGSWRRRNGLWRKD